MNDVLFSSLALCSPMRRQRGEQWSSASGSIPTFGNHAKQAVMMASGSARQKRRRGRHVML